MAKFFIDKKQINEDFITITDEDAKHIKNVLRHTIGDEIICSDGEGNNYKTKIENFDNNIVTLKVFEKNKDTTEPKIKITLYQALPKSDKMDLIIQKSVELGVNDIVPVITKRTIVKIDPKSIEKKVTRWNRISLEAAKQSGRGIVPTVDNICKLKDIKLQDYDLVIIPYENEKDIFIKEVFKSGKHKYEKIAVIIGPEGGFDPSEIESLNEPNTQVVSLGKRILRTETASLAVLSMLNYEFVM